MADEQHRWLDRETAERLLSGESLEAVDMAARDRAERLAKTLDALTAEPSPTSAELPGEAAALAAFREARAHRADDWVSGAAQAPARAGTRSSDAGLVRLGGPDGGDPRPRRSRTVRFALAAALTVGMVGGVAAAVGTGVLPTPFGESEADPAATVSAAATPNRPLGTPSPAAPGSEPVPDGSAGAGQGASRDTARGGSTPGTGGSGDRTGRPGRTGAEALSACRDMRDGKGLAADRRRTLEGAAGGSSYVKKYCEGVLKGATATDDDATSRTQRDGKDGKGSKDGKEDDGEAGRGDNGRGESGSTGGQGGRDGNGDGADAPRLAPDHHGRASDGGPDSWSSADPSSSDGPSTAAPLQPNRASASSDPSPTPTYTTL
jgi:hypothetical protein